MNHKRIRVFALSVILALLAVPCITWAQADCYDESEPGCGPWVDLGPIPLPHTPPIDLNGCGFSFADVQYRNCGGKMEINYSGLTETDIYPGGCEFFKDSSLMQLADLIIMNWMGSLSSGLGFGTPGPCDGGAGGYLTSVQFITTSCYIWQGCTYNTEPGPPVSCTPPDNPPGPPPGSQVTVWTWHSCGTACCERDYSICSDPDDPLDLDILLTNQQIIGHCTGQSSWSATCNNGCSND